jgi:PEP-CTERM motif
MKAHRFSWPIGGAVVLALLICGAEQARATSMTIVDFEDLNVPSGNHVDYLTIAGVNSRGFNYAPGPMYGSSGFNDLHISHKEDFRAYNETTVGISHDDVVLTKVGGGTFSLHRFDFAGEPNNEEVAFKVTGVLADDSTIEKYFIPDGKVDGDVWGGVDDFETFELDSKWTKLKSVTWKHTGYGTDRGLFALDNLVVDKPMTVPEPSTVTLLGLGMLCLLGQGWRARKRLLALARMT